MQKYPVQQIPIYPQLHDHLRNNIPLSFHQAGVTVSIAGLRRHTLAKKDGYNGDQNKNGAAQNGSDTADTHDTHERVSAGRVVITQS